MKNKKNNAKINKNAERAKNIDLMIEKVLSDENMKSKNDPDGSYTGVADPSHENVVQDVDDL